MTVTINGNGTVADSTYTMGMNSAVGFKNRIINGTMEIDQRNAGASVTPTADVYTLDRWLLRITQSSKVSVQQNAGAVTPPAGFINYLGVTSLSAYSVISTDFFCIGQYVEGLNAADLAWGTADAKSVTLSFWVRSSLTGTFSGFIENSSVNRSYTFTYTISSANTWELKTVTVAGDTTGTWLTTNGIGLRVFLSLGCGSGRSQTAGAWTAAETFGNSSAVSVVGTNGATFYITGVQLEPGTQATAFERRAYGHELMLCQRYCYVYNGAAFEAIPMLGTAYSSTRVVGIAALPATTRSSTTTVSYAGAWLVSDGVTSTDVTAIASGGKSYNGVVLDFAVAAGLTQYRPYYSYGNSAAAKLIVSAEL